jgi:TetR/AcrR family transcriptional repressor of nem operon
MPRTGRPRGFEEEQALERAMELFWRRGYEATSMQDLVDELGLNRSSLYAAFGDKHALYLRALDRYLQMATSATAERLGGTDAPVRATLRAWLHEVATNLCASPGRRGCFMVNAAIELGGHDAHAAGRLERAFATLEDVFAAAVQRGQRSGELDARLDARAVARFLLTMVIGLRARGRTNVAEEDLHDSVELALRALQP